MPEIALRPSINSGQIIDQSGTFVDMSQWRDQGYIVTQLNFFNQGTNSTAIINIGGADVQLPPGNLKQGANLVLNQPAGFYDTTKYRVSFINAGTGGTQVNLVNLIVTITKIIPPDR